MNGVLGHDREECKATFCARGYTLEKNILSIDLMQDLMTKSIKYRSDEGLVLIIA